MVDALVKYIQWIFLSIKGVRAVWIDSFSHLYDADWRSESWTDEDAVVFGERHLILRQNDGNDACRVTSLRHVLVLLYVQRQRQTYDMCVCVLILILFIICATMLTVKILFLTGSTRTSHIYGKVDASGRPYCLGIFLIVLCWILFRCRFVFLYF